MRVLSAEFVYAVPTAEPYRTRILTNLRARLDALRPGDGVLILAGSAAALDVVQPLKPPPGVTHFARIVTPQRLPGSAAFAQTDRWARIDAALACAAEDADRFDALLMPALDAVYTRRLIDRLIDRSGGRVPVSAWTPCHHAGDGPIAAAMNAAFNRDRTFRRRLLRGETQQFWGKLGLLPTALCAGLRAAVRDEHRIWEDDMVIDRTLNALGHPAVSLWIGDPAVYRLHPPVFTEADLYRVIERHLHYALHGGSGLLLPPDRAQRRLMARDPAYAAAVALADRLIAAARAALETRLAASGESAVIWGEYRITARRGDPFVRVEPA
jgi:hypothetical protein